VIVLGIVSAIVGIGAIVFMFVALADPGRF